MKKVALAALVCAIFPISTPYLIAQSSSTLTLTTYNIHSAVPNGKSSANHWPTISDVKNIADVLTETGAQIIALQEVRNLWSDPKVATPEQYPINMPLYLATLLDMNYAFGSGLDVTPRFRENREYMEWGHSTRWTNNNVRHGEYGNAILTSFTMVTPPQILKLPRGTDEQAKKLGDEPRLALRVELKDEIPGLGKVIIYSTHFQHNNSNTRRMQMRSLVLRAKEDLKPRKDGTTATVFLMGDFNHLPAQGGDPFLELLAENGFLDLAAEHAKATGTEPHHTMNSGKPVRIDYIFSSRPVKIRDVSVINSDASDHLPLSVTIELP